MKKIVTLLFFSMLCSTLMAVSSPYPVDADTLHLWNFDAQANGVVLDISAINPKNLNLVNGAFLEVDQVGFGKSLNTYDGEAVNQVYAGDDVNPVLISELTGSDGAFTFEAIVKPAVAQNAIGHHMEIICLEDDDSAAGERGFQFRINNNGMLRFQTLAGIVVSFDASISFTADQWYHVAVAYNGQENTADNLKLYWTELGSGTSAQVVGSYQLDEDLKSDVSSFFCVGNELRPTGGYTENFEGLIDEVRISSVGRSADDMIFRSSVPWPKNPVPAAAEKLATLDAISDLQWDTAEVANVTSHYLYFWKDEPNYIGAAPIVVTDLTDPITVVLPVILESDSLYFWRVDESVNNSAPGDAATVTGPVWVFETPPSVPVIRAEPESVRVIATEPADIICEFTSLSEPTVQWFKVGSASPLSNGSDLAISLLQDGYTYTATLHFATPDVTDEGEYYCEITNDADKVSSSNAFIIVKRLLVQYDFESSLAPTAGEADAPTGSGKSLAGLAEPNEPDAVSVALAYETGFDGVGQAVVVGTNEYIDFTVEGYPKAGTVDGGLGLGMDAGTLVCWVKPVSAVADGILFQNFNDGYSTGFNLNITENDTRIYVRNDNNTQFALTYGVTDRPGWDMFDGNWHMLAFTWEIAQPCSVYIDGQPAGISNASLNAIFAPWQHAVLIGAGRQTSNRQFLQPEFATSVDCLRIYNYRLDEESNDVFAQEYLDATGVVPCIEINFDGVQYNFDNTGSSYCQVDLADFAAFAAAWMNSGLFDGQ